MAPPNALLKDRDNFLARLFKNNRQELCHYLRARYGAGSPDPEDVVQTAFLKLSQLENLHRLRNPKAFLYRVARNHLIDGRRHQATCQRYLDAEQRCVTETGSDSDPANVLQSEQDAAVLERTIMSMDARERDFLLLFRIHGLSYTEIARRSGMSRNGVKMVIARAMTVCESALESPPPVEQRL
ncbi:RNA polymerase sigma factor [Parahaliea mediterranea]|uniref:RNA polymerase sigma factor n=1 Tax=Parahaliea mediterranea TaxID=651086 RepID=UPI000E2E831A|nr:sigma-70 family RNA polymerase sigma factor [Parahaliea mediterranea]